MADNGEFVQSIRDATAKIALDMEKKVSQACLVVEGEARQLCPVDQGHLRASITSETEITADEIIGRIGSNLEYAPYVHNGTGIYAVNGDGRKTPWVYEVKAGKYKVMHFTTVGQRPKPFLSFAIIYNAAQIEKILGVLSWNLANMSLLSTGVYTEDKEGKKKDLIFTGDGKALKTVLLRAVHTKENGKKIRFTMIGQGGSGFAITWENKEVTIDAELTAIKKVKGFLASFEEELTDEEAAAIVAA